MKHFFNSKSLLLLLLSCCCVVVSCKQGKTPIATIAYDYSGCFASGKSRIAVYKTDTSTIAQLETEGILEVKAKLNAAQLDTLQLFVNILRAFGNGGFCTTVSHYTVTYNGETITRTDNSCEWNGFDNLKECLFRNGFYPVKME